MLANNSSFMFACAVCPQNILERLSIYDEDTNKTRWEKAICEGNLW